MQYLLIAVGVIIMATALSLVFSIPVWLLWNWLMPIIFSLPKITWMQAWGLSFLCNVMFKSQTSSRK